MRADRGLTSDSAIAGMQVGGSVGTNSIFLWTPSDPFRTLAALRTGGPNNATYCTDHSGNFLFQSARFGFCSLYNKVKRGFCYTVLASPGCDLFVPILQKKHMIPCGTHITLFQSRTVDKVLVPNDWTSCCFCFGIPSSGLSFFSPSNGYGLEPRSTILFSRPFTSYC